MDDLAELALRYVKVRDCPDLTLRQLALLAFLCSGHDASHARVKAAASELGVQKPVITRAVNTLAALGLVRRAPDPDDRRNIFLVVTAAGYELRQKMRGSP